MITFLTLFLGLVTGPQTLQVAVDPGVVRVDYFIDDAFVGAVSQAPWSLEIDLGHRLLPHTLVAVARDGEGRELGRARQEINLPRRRAEARLILARSAGGAAQRVELVWETAEDLAPVRFRALLDGVEVAAGDLPARPPASFELPSSDPEKIHQLAAELRFHGGVQAHAVATFGGRYGDQVDAELTPLAVRAAEPLPPAPGLAGWFLLDGEPLPVFAVDGGEAEVVLVRDRRAASRLGSAVRRARNRRFYGETRPDSQAWASGLRRGDELHLVGTVPELRRGGETLLFPTSADLARHGRGGIGRVLAEVVYAGNAQDVQHLADAVASAGRTAVDGGRRRMVILVAEPGTEDGSHWDVATVRGYLRAIQVPLRVWSPVPPEALGPLAAWGEVESVASRAELGKAVERVRRDLDHQYVVWIVGRVRAAKVRLSEAARPDVELLP